MGNFPNKAALRLDGLFNGLALRELWQNIKRIGLVSYGFTNAWKCAIGLKEFGLEADIDSDSNLHPYCLSLLKQEIAMYSPKVVDLIGGGVFKLLSSQPAWAYKTPGRISRIDVLGDIPVMNAIHPEQTFHQKIYLKTLEEHFDRLKEFLQRVARL